MGEVVHRIKVQATGAQQVDKLTQAVAQLRFNLEGVQRAGGTVSGIMAQAAAQQARAAQSALQQAQAARSQMDSIQGATKAAREMATAQKEQTASGASVMDTLKSGVSVVRSYGAALIGVTQYAMDGARALYEFAASGQKLKGLDVAFKQLGGNAKELDDLRKATGGVVDDATLKRVYNLGSLFELPQDKIKDLIRLAKGASVALGTTTAKALEDTFTAASRQSKMIADNMGIVIGDMRQMYEEYARSIGKSADELTDKEKQRAFILRMIEKGQRQVDLAAAASSNAYAAAEAAATNWLNALKVGFADAFEQSGMLASMNEAFGELQGMMDGAGGALMSMLVPAFKALMMALPAVVGLFGSLLPILDLAGPLLTMIASVLQLLTPLLGGLVYVLSQVIKTILEFVGIALLALLKGLREVASVVSDDFAAGFDKAIATLEKGIVPMDAATAAAEKQKEKVLETAQAWGILEEVQRRILVEQGKGKSGGDVGEELFAARLGVTPEQLGRINANMEKFQKEYQTRLAYLATKGYSYDEIAKMDAATQKALVANAGKTKDQLKALEDRALRDIASDHAKALELGKGQADALVQIVERKNEEVAANERFAAKQRVELAQSNMEAMWKMFADERAFGTSSLAALMEQGSKDEEAALIKLEGYYEQHSAYIQELYKDNAEQLALNEAMLAEVVNRAAEELETKKAQRAKRGGGRGGNDERAIMQARLAVMAEEERQIYELRFRFSEMANKLPKKEAALKTQLAREAEAQIINLQAERIRREREEMAASVQAQREQQRALTAFMADEYTARLGAAKNAINDEADARRQALIAAPVVDMGQLAAVEAQRMRLIAKAEAEAMTEALGGAFEPMAKRWDEYREKQREAQEKDLKEAEMWAGAMQGMSASVIDGMFAMMNGTEDARTGIFKMMGQVFAQLSTAFLAWATAEGNLLAGNPWGAAAAAIALGAVASAISAFGARKPAGGGGSRQATRALNDDTERKGRERGEGGVVIYAMGFATPDSIAGAMRRGGMRGAELDGRGQ